MVNWMDPAEIKRDGDAFAKLIHCLLGLYIWEWATSLGFDISYIRGKRKFRWPLIFYFLNRYCLLIALIGIAVALNVTVEIDCQSLYTFNQVFGNASIGLASINLSLRTIAVWSQAWYIWVPLVLVIMGHWSLLLHGVLLKAEWIPPAGCVITSTDNKLLAVSFIYSMAFDFLVLSLTAWKLVISAPSSKAMGRSKLVVLIFGDGLIYFLIAFLANLLATIFMLLNLNPVMSIIANVPAAIASSIVACRAMETFESPSSRTYGEYDAMGNIITKGSPSDDFDAEAQEIRDEFKRPRKSLAIVPSRFLTN
uniref:Transmembrane protein n=1 Tax=Moniliophthora roreri TaxID=221103 RepID=A0A0W0FTF3_MONRR